LALAIQLVRVLFWGHRVRYRFDMIFLENKKLTFVTSLSLLSSHSISEQT
jgi:hypothetical protein